MKIFGDWIYDNATIYLKRKYEAYLLFKEHYSVNEKYDNTELTN